VGTSIAKLQGEFITRPVPTRIQILGTKYGMQYPPRERGHPQKSETAMRHITDTSNLIVIIHDFPPKDSVALPLIQLRLGLTPFTLMTEHADFFQFSVVTWRILYIRTSERGRLGNL